MHDFLAFLREKQPDFFATAEAEQRRQHLHVRENWGITFHEDTCSLKVFGQDRQKLLHSLLANEITALSPGSGNYAHLLDPKGKVQAAMEVFALPDAHRLLCHRPWGERIKKNIAMRIFRADVKIVDEENLLVLGAHGPKAAAVLKESFPGFPVLQKEYDHGTLTIDGHSVMVCREHVTGEVGFYFVLGTEQAPALWSKLAALPQAQVFGAKAFESLSMEAGVPLFGVDYNEENLSLEVNLNKAVSNSKGCYLGQEPVARILSRGHVAKRLIGLRLKDGAALPPNGTEIHALDSADETEAQRPIGHVTRSIYSPSLKTNIAFAFLKFQFLEDHPQAKVALQDPQTKNLIGQAIWQNLPFYTASGINWLSGGPQMQRVVAPNPKSL